MKNMDYYRMKSKHQRRIARMYNRRAAGEMTREQFYAAIDRMIRQKEAAADLDQYGTGFLADLATDSLRASGLTDTDDLWPWIAGTFRICWSEWYTSARIQNAVGLACIRIFGRERKQAKAEQESTP